MTLSNKLAAMLTHIRRTLTRVLRKVTLTSATLTLSIPGFIKLEIKTEPKPELKPRRRPRRT